MLEGMVVGTDQIGKRAGTRYRVELAAMDESLTALVYMEWDRTDNVPYLWCFLHKSAACQCVAAVRELRKDAGL